ncbi:MAG: holo-ACP synthase [Corynebacterium sp.]|nr:holo-ACP synthase [Corynebacterium sp.]
MTIGCDLVHVPSFAAQLAIPGTTMWSWFTPTERAQSRGPESLAARWAAKEAFIKAWSAQHYAQEPVMTEQQVRWAEIEVVCDTFGRPRLFLHGAIEEISGISHAEISLSHEEDYAIAVCTL